MKHAAIEETEAGRRTGLLQATRSPVLNQFRLNPFRVLRVPTDVGVDQAIWKAEELITRLRMGLPAAEPDPLPWLPEAEEAETRQSIKRIEEPLPRLTEQLFWFATKADPAGESLRTALAGLDG